SKAKWNAVTLLTMWEESVTTTSLPRSGGRVTTAVKLWEFVAQSTECRKNDIP
ncbi:hypothetical protein A2U01_0091217, partial [Trifolium medium]|nr:hypothetical protein [Trifolium medium]